MSSYARLPHQIPYAKTNLKNPEEVHLLLYHLIDVGQVALVMWREVLTDAIRRRMAALLGLSVEDCGRYVAFLVALHDLGKAGPAYQKKYAPDWLLAELARAGLILNGSGRAYDPTFPHGTVTTWALDTLLPELLGTDQRLAHKIAVAVGGHHGVWPQEQDLKHVSDSKHPQWEQVRRQLFSELVAVFAPPMTVTPPAGVTQMNAFLTIFSGLTSVADWVGSQNDRYFGYIGEPMPARRYALDSLAKARTALNELGWMGWQPTGKAQSFAETFAYLGFGEPRPVQQQVIQAAVSQAMPTLIVIEAPTGIGKTELALYIADCWLQQHAGRGLYVAMPTQSTSNQMYTRVGEFLHQRYSDSSINFHLVHGQAAWLDDLKQQVELQGVGDDGKAHLVAENWFNPRKRTLLAPFGVGTVDQALMSVLQTKHFFVRLFGLSHKVVIFDEVHAYDAYMSTIFHLLLTWLSAIGASVIILSATLPGSTRRALIKAYTGKDLPTPELIYPALTIANAEQQNTLLLPKPNSYTLNLDRTVCWDPSSICAYLCSELKQGGFAAVVCNRVQRAQEVYRLLDEARLRGELEIVADDLILFHGRFLPIWRKDIEQKVLRKFGKDGNRQGRAIVVATQVIEQSLDIDFDLMLTDWAPIDLLLQRAGRLHRHTVNDGHRHGIERKLTVIEPSHNNNGAPDFGKDIHVYDEYVLVRTYGSLQGKAELRIPDDTPILIETVYDPQQPIQLPPGIEQEHMEQLWQKLETDKRNAQMKAEKNLVLAPDRPRLLVQESFDLDEDNPSTHEMLRAQTRDIDFSVTLICLQREDDGLYVFTDNDQKLRVDSDVEPDRDVAKVLLQNALAIQNRSVGKYFVEQAVPHSWANNAALRYSRHAIFDQGSCDLPQYTLKLSRQLGLEIIKKEQA